MNSNTELMLDVGQANELKLAFRKHGWTNAEIKRLCQGKLLSHVRKILLGEASIKPIDPTEYLEAIRQASQKDLLIDLDADPFMPINEWELEQHNGGGMWEWDPAKIVLEEADDGWNGSGFNRTTISSMLEYPGEKRIFLNANVLDFLLANHQLIPLEWKYKRVQFLGTIYRVGSPMTFPYARYLGHKNSRWGWGTIAVTATLYRSDLIASFA